MPAKIVRYYACDENMGLTCTQCGWMERAKEADCEYHRELFGFSCPSCEQALLIVPYPTFEEMKAESASGNERARRDLNDMRRALESKRNFEAKMLKSVDQLPELHDAESEFVWDIDEESTLIKHRGKVVWKEPAIFEGWSRFNEIKDLLKLKYGASFRSLTPTRASEFYLYGDDLSAPRKISFD